MPKEILNQEEFLTLAENASKCTVKRNPNHTKLKLRTNRYMYTIKLKPDEADVLISKLSCPIEEI